MSEHRWSVLSQAAQLAQVWRGTQTSVTSAFGSVGEMSVNRVVETQSAFLTQLQEVKTQQHAVSAKTFIVLLAATL